MSISFCHVSCDIHRDVCVCVCVREIERERERERERDGFLRETEQVGLVSQETDN